MTNPYLDHIEALNFAKYKRDYSNESRCYIDLYEKNAALSVALNDVLNMLRAAHIQLGMQHDTNARVIKARAALAAAKAKP